MLSLSPAKLLVILVVALIVLGPDKLPQMARQLGAFWHDLRQWRGRIESEVRDTFPNLPPTHEVARVVRSPLAFLDRLADEHERELEEKEAGRSAAADDDLPAPDAGPSPGGGGEQTPRAGIATNGAASGPVASAAVNGAAGAVAENGASAPGGVGSAGTGWVGPGTTPGAASGTVAADDPSMN